MKRLIIFTAQIVLMIMYVFGCSKDHDAPTIGKYSNASTPSDMVATYNTATDQVDLSWSMDGTDSVSDYYIGISDSSVYSDGNIVEFFTNISEDIVQNSPYSISVNASKCIPYASTNSDSLILYFTVSAVYNNETFSNFIGPQADVDSTLVNR